MGDEMNITLRPDFNLWWPDYDHNPVACMSFVRKGLTDMDVAIQHCAKRRICVQAGGHVGLWPKRLAEFFQCVYAFECEPLLAECMRRNLKDVPNVLMVEAALGSFVGDVKMQSTVSAGSWHISETGNHTARQTTIDALALKRCDAIFLDVEAYEVEALKGAWETIERCRPVIMVEELPRSRNRIRAHMKSIGYAVKAKVHADVVYTHAH